MILAGKKPTGKVPLVLTQKEAKRALLQNRFFRTFREGPATR